MDAVTYSTLFSICAESKDIAFGIIVHKRFALLSGAPSIITITSLLSILAEDRCLFFLIPSRYVCKMRLQF